MSSSEAITIKLLIAGSVYDFATIEPVTNDYSVFIRIYAGATSGKERRASYHPTGAVKHHNLATSDMQFFQPLCGITELNLFLMVALDQAELKLAQDQEETSEGNTIVWDMTNSAPFLAFALAPIGAVDTFAFNGWAIRRIGFAILLCDMGERPSGFWPGTWALAPEPKYAEMAMSREQAELAYVKLLWGTDGAVITGPNGDHYRTHYPTVPMSRVPDVVIKGGPPDLRGEVHDSSKPHKVKIRFVDKHGVVKDSDPQRISGEVFLNARLRMLDRE